MIWFSGADPQIGWGGGGGGDRENPFHGGGKVIFWNYVVLSFSFSFYFIFAETEKVKGMVDVLHSPRHLLPCCRSKKRNILINRLV